MKRTGFTLIELLVVLGILGLLTAMLFPVFARAREKGRQTVCLNNEKQLGMAFLMYTHDNDGFYMFPHAWAGKIYPYVKSVEVFHCPSDATTAQPPYYPVSYGMNVNIRVIPLTMPRNRVVATPASDLSSKTVLLFEVVHSSAQITILNEGWSATAAPLSSSVESNGFFLDNSGVFWDNAPFSINNDVRYATGPMSWNGPDIVSSYYEGTGRHHDGANFLFSDAHVQWLNPRQVSTGSDAVSPTTYQEWVNGAVVRAAGSESGAFAATFSRI